MKTTIPQHQYARLGKVIYYKNNKTEQHFKSINAAKRESFNIQMKERGALGRGILISG